MDWLSTPERIGLPSGAMTPSPARTTPLAARLLRPLTRLHRRVLLHRRWLAALTAAAAVLLTVRIVSPPPAETTVVWTARHDLASGTALSVQDLAPARFLPGTVPRSAVLDPRKALGRTLAAPMSRGEVLTTLRTLSAGLLRGYPGRTAVPLRITDAAVVDLLRVGDRVSFVAADPDGRAEARLLLRDAPVLAVPRAESGGFSTGTPGRLVIAGVPSASATEVAARAATSVLIPVWDR